MIDPQTSQISIRRRILEILQRGPVTLHALAAELGLREREAADHLAHAPRSVHGRQRVKEEPAECLACGFAFRKRERVTTPGRCPRCRSERVRPGLFSIEDER